MGFSDKFEGETLKRLTEFLGQRLDAGVVSADSLARALTQQFVVVEKGAVEFHKDGGEWTGVYMYGKLVDAHDTYHADDWLQDLVGVETKQSNFLKEDGYTAYPTTQAIADAELAKAEAKVAELVAEREALLAKATADVDARIAEARAAASRTS